MRYAGSTLRRQHLFLAKSQRAPGLSAFPASDSDWDVWWKGLAWLFWISRIRCACR